MKKNYETPNIQVIEFETEISLAVSAVVNYPWQTDEDFEFFE